MEFWISQRRGIFLLKRHKFININIGISLFSIKPHKITFAGTLPGRPSRGRGGAAPPSILRSFPPRENDYAGSITTEEVNNTNNAQVSITNGHSQV